MTGDFPMGIGAGPSRLKRMGHHDPVQRISSKLNKLLQNGDGTTDIIQTSCLLTPILDDGYIKNHTCKNFSHYFSKGNELVSRT
jgi:hypothetical protein